MSFELTHRQSAALVQDSAELLTLAQEAGQLGLFEWRVQIGTIRLSPKLMSLYGLTDFDGRYESWLNCLFQEDVVRITDQIDRTFADRAREFYAEFRFCRHSDNELRWMEARHIILYDEGGKPGRVVGINADVTERKRALVQLHAFRETLEESVKERTRQLEAENEARLKVEALLRQAQKMEAVGQLTGGIAHDFNNLLTLLLGGLETIGRQVQMMAPSPPVTRIARAHEMAVHGAQRAVSLTNRLLAFSRQQPLDPKPIDANKLVAGMTDFLQRTLGESVALETVLSPGLWRTYADINQLENALLNLSLNARDAIHGDGKVTIETANCYLDDSYVLSLPEPVAPGQYVMIAVADNGTGMDEATVEHAFEPFFTTKDVGKGTGLGLSQVYGFVRQSAGNVKIYSEPKEGTTVKIYLPRFTGPEATLDVAAVACNSGAIMGVESILVVEDDEMLRAYTTEVLRDLGYRVLDARNAATALEILAREQAIDLLFTDVVIPGGMNGRQLAEEAVRRKAGLKVLFTTGYTRNAIVHHGRLDPGVNLLAKPYSPNELANKIRSLLDKLDQ
ncbi:MAG TPA: ATP-binding protein [Candidatus Acidoferrales bacterium]